MAFKPIKFLMRELDEVFLLITIIIGMVIAAFEWNKEFYCKHYSSFFGFD